MGAILQTITPELAAGLQLQRDFGIIVSDVSPGGPADTAGLKIQDIILTIDGTPAGSLPMFTHSLYMHGSGERVRVEVLRGSQRMPLNIPLVDRPHKEDSLIDVADPEKNTRRRLGIIEIELNLPLAQLLPEQRHPPRAIW